MFARIRISPNKGKYSAAPLSPALKPDFYAYNSRARRFIIIVCYRYLNLTGKNQVVVMVLTPLPNA